MSRPPHKPNRRPPQGKPPTSGKPPAAPTAAPRPQELIEVALRDMANGGSAVGRYQGRTVFVPYAIPGEVVQAKVLRSEAKTIFAEGVQLLEASADRVKPQCSHFGPTRCRNCQWQHIAYPAQALIKQDVLVDQLARLGKFDDATLEKALQPLIRAPHEWHYNQRMTLELADGKMGFLSTDGRTIEPLMLCHVLHPDLQTLYEALDFDFPQVKRLHLVKGDEGAMLMLELNGEDAPELNADFPISVNVILPDNEPMNLVGDTAVSYRIQERTLRVTAGSSFRANVPQIGRLVQAVVAAAQLTGTERVWDVYAGVGTFSAFLAPHAAHVTVVESYPPAVTDADTNLADFEHVDLIEGSAEDVLPELESRPDVVVLDPPSAGLSGEVFSAVVRRQPARIVYVSGNPASLARDAAAFVTQGYRLTRVQPLDFAPQTYYVEAVIVLERQKQSKQP
jgi:23S rRNA (uracil1939-C5)-methyltransferase